jgi:anti-anti-sigma factor
MVIFDYNSEEKIIKVVFSGRMDYLAVQKLSEILQSEPMIKNFSSEDKIIFDIQEVDYIASSFIRICVMYAKLAGHDRFSITNCQPFVKKTFKISGLDEVLNIS